MTIGIGTNIASLKAQRILLENSSSLSKTFERLSSGLRINRASDDAAGLAISNSLNVHARVYTQGVRNLNDGISALQIADGAIQSLSQIVTRMRELAQQAANGALSLSQRRALDEEAQSLGTEYLRIARSTSFNGMNLFDGSLQNGIRLQAGFGSNGSIQSSLGGVMGNGALGASTPYSTPVSPYSVALGDLNGDGFADMVSAANGDDRILIRYGLGDGTFSAVTSMSTGSLPSAVRLGDVNGDGALDIVTADYGIATLSVFIGRGDGTFQNRAIYSTGGSPYSMALGDLNGDSVMDIVTANYGDSTVSILMGRGDGTFGAAATYATVLAPRAVTLGDLNNDGILDVVTTGDGGSVGIRLGSGSGALLSQSTLSLGSFSKDVTLGDLNGDGMLDLVAAHGGGSLYVFMGRGDGTFGAAQSFSTNGPQSVELGDMNGDGSLDIVVADGTGSKVSVLLGNGNGTFSAGTSYTTGLNPYEVALGDVNGDGVLDVVTANYADGSTSVLLGNTREGIAPLLPFSLVTQADARQALAPLERKLSQLSTQRGTIGAFQSRLTAALNVLTDIGQNYAAAESRIRDADIAVEAANMVRVQISQQAATAVLAQVNFQGRLALDLLS